MKALCFLEQTVSPNAEALLRAPGDFRLAVNAILTTDAFFGINWAESKKSHYPGSHGDGGYRNEVARESECYRLVRDAALSLKHGNLDSKNRLVRQADQTQALPAIWNDDGSWSDDCFWSDDLVVIETEGRDGYRTDKLVEEVVHIAMEDIAPTGRSPMRLVAMKSVLN